MDSFVRKTELNLKDWFFQGKALVLIGARQVGKTTMLQQLVQGFDNLLWLNADDAEVRQRFEVLSLANLRSIVGDYKFIILDEVQRIENAGLLLKMLVDNFKDVQVVATGSSSIDISDKVFEPLTGRHILFYLYPFSMAELYAKKSDFEIQRELPFHLVYGLYPDVALRRNQAVTLLKNLANQYLYKDVLAWKDIRRPELLDKLLRLLSFQVGMEVSYNELGRQLGIKSETVSSYVDLLEKSFVVFRLQPYSSNPRKEVAKMNKIYFWDNGIRNAVIGNYDDLNLRADKGQLWENFIIAERLKANAWSQSNSKPYFWRSLNQSEVDLVEWDNNKLSAYEMKWDSGAKAKVSRAFTNLYPDAATQVITPQTMRDFCRI